LEQDGGSPAPGFAGGAGPEGHGISDPGICCVSTETRQQGDRNRRGLTRDLWPCLR
jgi:hypothetical protein